SAEIERGGLVATDRLLHPAATHWSLVFVGFEGRTMTWSRSRRVAEAEVAGAARFLRLGMQSAEPAQVREAGGFLGAAILDKSEGLPRQARRRWQPADRPGIYRREHASVLVRSQTTSVLLDPTVLIGDFIPHFNEAPQDLGTDRIDAVLV